MTLSSRAGSLLRNIASRAVSSVVCPAMIAKSATNAWTAGKYSPCRRSKRRRRSARIAGLSFRIMADVRLHLVAAEARFPERALAGPPAPSHISSAMGHASSAENLGVRAQNTQLRCGVGLLVVALFAAALMHRVGAS